MEEIVSGKPYTSEGRTCFRSFGLQSFLARMGFKDFRRNEVSSALKSLGGINRQERIGGVPIRFWDIPEFPRGDEKPWRVPPMEPRPF
jgi:hypothetical protein